MFPAVTRGLPREEAGGRRTGESLESPNYCVSGRKTIAFPDANYCKSKLNFCNYCVLGHELLQNYCVSGHELLQLLRAGKRTIANYCAVCTVFSKNVMRGVNYCKTIA